MARTVLLLVFLAGSWAAAGAQDLGRSALFQQQFLSETVRRGLPLAEAPDGASRPFWPGLDRIRREAEGLEPGTDTALTGALADLAQGRPSEAQGTLTSSWPPRGLLAWPSALWGRARFVTPPSAADQPAWIAAWLAWTDKVYAPAALAEGLKTFETADPSAVEPLLTQALALYPDDRRFLPLAARHPAVAPDVTGLWSLDLQKTGGFSPAVLASLGAQSSSAAALAAAAGYPAERVTGPRARDYGLWLTTSAADGVPADGEWVWDADQDGRFESRLVISGGTLRSWTRESGPEDAWTLTFEGGRPAVLTEVREGASWTLAWERYPAARDLTYRWQGGALIYKFPPLAQVWPLGPEERWKAPGPRVPAALGTVGLVLDPRALAARASSIEIYEAGVRTSRLALAQGQIWLKAEDTDANGADDQWSFFRGGVLASVYRDPSATDRPDLREVYRRGELVQVQKRAATAPRTELALFPLDQVQLWDPEGQGRPLDRVFRWTGDRLDALVFTGADLPWSTMPPWEPRP